MLMKIQNLDLVAKEALYHPVCRTRYQAEAGMTQAGMETRKSEQQTKLEQPLSYWHQEREVHAQAFESLTLFIQEDIIDN